MVGLVMVTMLLAIDPSSGVAADRPAITGVTVEGHGDATVVDIRTSGPAPYQLSASDDASGLIVSFADASYTWNQTRLTIPDGHVAEIRGEGTAETARIEIRLRRLIGFAVTATPHGVRVAFDDHPMPPDITIHDGRVTAHVTRVPALQVIEILERQSGLRLVLHVATDHRVTLRAVDRPLDEVLGLMFGSHNLVSVYASTGLREIHVYDVTDVAPPTTAFESPAPTLDWALAGVSDPRPTMREKAVRALAKGDAERAVAALVPVLGADAIAAVREATAWALGETGSAGAVPALMRALGGDERQHVRQAAAQALGKIGSASAIDALVTATHDVYAGVRESAVDALVAIGPEHVVSALIDVAQHDPHPDVRDAARRALERHKRPISR